MKFSLRNESSFLWTFLFFIHVLEGSGQALTCYKCNVAPVLGEDDDSSRICSKFDESEQYVVECPKSTLCMKKTIHHRLVNGTIVTTSRERGCAPQLDASQAYDFTKRTWRYREKIVKSAYEEGCFIGVDKGSPGGPAEYCYCRYHLCNSSESLNHRKFLFSLSLIIPSLIILLRNELLSS